MNNNYSTPLISIIVPVYNVQEYVSKCLLSICRQTYQNLEIIVIDDGSTDDSGRICDMLAKQDNRIKVVHQSNGGQSFARNRGLSMASGEYIGFVDGDDWIKIDMYEALYYLLLENDADISVCSHYVVKSGGIKTKYASGKISVYSSEEAMKVLIEDRLIRSYVWDKLYKRDLFDQICFPINRLFEDLAVSYRIFHRAKRVTMQQCPKYYYLVREGSAMQSKYDPLREFQLFLGVYERDQFVRANYCWKELPSYVLQRGVHLIDHAMMLSPSEPTEKIVEKVLKIMHEYDHDHFAYKSITLKVKCFFIYRHRTCYRHVYRAVRMLFKLKRYKF